jgi:hypothetical protein
MKLSKLTIIGQNQAIKTNSLFEKKFIYTPCPICGEWISNSGRANKAHFNKHNNHLIKSKNV